MKSLFVVSRFWIWLPMVVAMGTAIVPLRGEPPADPKPVPPPGNLINRAPELASWVVRDEASPDDAAGKPDLDESQKKKPRKEPPKPTPASGSVEHTTFTKSGPVLRIELTQGQTTKMDKWCRGDVQVTTRPEWSEPLVSVSSNPFDAGYTDYSKSDFPELSWLSRKNYAGLEEVQDRVCLVFRDKIEVAGNESKAPNPPAAPEETPNATPVPVGVMAYVDYYSRLPVRFTHGDVTRTYWFVMPPTHNLEIPPTIQAVIDERLRHLKDLTRPPAKPY